MCLLLYWKLRAVLSTPCEYIPAVGYGPMPSKPFSLCRWMVMPSRMKFDASVGIPMPRLTYLVVHITHRWVAQLWLNRNGPILHVDRCCLFLMNVAIVCTIDELKGRIVYSELLAHGVL